MQKNINQDLTINLQRVERIFSASLQEAMDKPLELGNVLSQLGNAVQHNLLLHGDNLQVLKVLADGLLSKYFAGHKGIKLIYLDPPFLVGSDFSIPVLASNKKRSFRGIPALAYSDSWPQEEDFYTMLFDRLALMRELLSEDGSIYVHCDWRTHARIRIFMDQLFGKNRFLSEIVWHYTGGGRSTRYFSRKHDLILHYAKSKNWIFNIDAVRVPFKADSGYAKGGITSAAGKRYLPNPLGTPIDDVWDIPIINPLSFERLGYPTQKPEALLERIIAASSNTGDLVMDPFCGSGTTAAVAMRLGRRFIAADASPFAVQTVYKRLVALLQNAGISASRTSGFDLYSLVPAKEDLSSLFTQIDEKKSDPTYCSVAVLDGSIFYSKPDLSLKIQRTGQSFQIELCNVSVAEMWLEDLHKHKNTKLSIKDSIPFWQEESLMQDSLEWALSWSVCLYDKPSGSFVADRLRCLFSCPVQSYLSPWISLSLPDNVAENGSTLQWALHIVDIFANEHYMLFTP